MTGLVQEARIYANVIGAGFGPEITPSGSLATLLWRHVLSQKNLAVTWGYDVKTGIMMIIPVLTVTLVVAVIRLSLLN